MGLASAGDGARGSADPEGGGGGGAAAAAGRCLGGVLVGAPPLALGGLDFGADSDGAALPPFFCGRGSAAVDDDDVVVVVVVGCEDGCGALASTPEYKSSSS